MDWSNGCLSLADERKEQMTFNAVPSGLVTRALAEICRILRNGRSVSLLLVFLVIVVGWLPVNAAIDPSSFANRVDFATEAGPLGVAVGDIDGDGKLDLATANNGVGADNTGNTISVLRNTSSPGAISFADKTNMIVGAGPWGIAIGDIDGDGKLDLAVTNNQADSISVLRNTSSPGTISFASNVDFSTGSCPVGIAIGDIDGDGKPDIAVSNYGDGLGNTVSIFRNTSTPGTISFADRVDFTTGSGPRSPAIVDVDGDGKPDVVIANYGAGKGMTISVLRNTSSPGTISFADKVDFATGTGPLSLVLGDIDGDGKQDVAVADEGSGANAVSVLRNTSSPGTISFAGRIDFPAGTGPAGIMLGNLDPDTKPDLAVTNLNGTTVSVLRNVSSPGTISYAARVGFPTGAGPYGVGGGDFDGDGRLDLAVSAIGDDLVSVLRNTSSAKSTASFQGLSSPTITYGTVSATLSGIISSGPLIPTGSVSITLNGVTQAATISGANGSFSSAFTTSSLQVSGSPYAITYAYPGDADFNSLGPDTSQVLTVTRANTTSTITSASPNPSAIGGYYTVRFNVTANAPSSGIPAGNVTVMDGSGGSCTATVTAGSCSLKSTSKGTKTLTASYAGNENFNGSTSAGFPHQVGNNSLFLPLLQR